MRRKSRHGSAFHPPSLVPLADMLANTVGIVVFILIFTVLTAGGAVAIRRLPMEHETAVNSREYYVCMSGKVFPLRHTLVKKLMDSVDDHSAPSVESFKLYARRANGASTADEHLRITLNTEFWETNASCGVRQKVTLAPTGKGGLYAGEVNGAGGFFRQDLQRLNPRKDAMLFFVKPDAIDAFVAARDLADKSGFAWNWVPQDPIAPLTLGLGGGGDDGFTAQ